MMSVGEHAVKWTDLILLGPSVLGLGCRALEARRLEQNRQQALKELREKK